MIQSQAIVLGIVFFEDNHPVQESSLDVTEVDPQNNKLLELACIKCGRA